MIRFDHVSLVFHDKSTLKEVFRDLNLSLPDGEIIAIMGPSGSGKTSLLRMIAGLLPPTLGNVTRETDSISHLFQDVALLPWLTAEQNVNLVLSDGSATRPIARRLLSEVGLAGEEHRYPDELSGGMQQRVGLARALAVDAELLLLDEPFRGLDESLHALMRDWIASQRRGKTTLIVTHDRSDLVIADRLLLLSAEKTPCLVKKQEFA